MYVELDFERGDLDGALEKAGHDNGEPTFWLWEGVTPYLTAAAQRAALQAIAARSAQGSQLTMEYVEPTGSKAHGIRWVVRALQEPYVGLINRTTAVERLNEEGWRVIEDTGPADWRRRYGLPALTAEGLRERIALAD